MKPKIMISLLAIATMPVLAVWLPFALNLHAFWGLPLPTGGMQTVISNFDGPLYIVIAKSLYNLPYIAQNFALDLPLEYYAAHFPLFPLLIKLFALLSGYPWGMMFATLFTSVITMYFFYKNARKLLNEHEALTLTLMFSFFPARWLIVRSVGSPEPLFMAAILGAIYYFNEKKYWYAAFWGIVAQLTKSPGILLFIALSATAALTELSKLTSSKQSIRKWLTKITMKPLPLLLIPASLIGLFVAYASPSTFGNFFAYFNSGDNIHLFFPPFQIFNYTQPWVNTFWLEDILFVYAIILVGITKLIKEKHTTWAAFVITFFATIIFVSHRDILRYSLPVFPFIFLAFANELQRKEAKIIFFLLAIPTFLYALSFIAGNVMPIADWTPYL